MAFWLPMGFNRADGTTPLPANPQGSAGGTKVVGTPDPVGMRTKFGDSTNDKVEEEVDSPEIERAEQATFQHRLKTSWANCLALIPMLGRGTFVDDSFGNVWRILSSKIQSARGGDRGTLSIVAESISFDSPPDEYQLVPVELGINIIKHPRYFTVLYPSPADFSTTVGKGTQTSTVANVKQAIIRAIQTYQDSPFFPSANNVNGLIQNQVINAITASKIPVQSGSATNTIDTTAGAGSAACLLAQAAAGEIIQKLWNQEDNPYIVGFEIKWKQYFFAPVFENPGGYIETPVGIVPDYFLSHSQFGPDTIFDQMALLNPQSYSTDGTSSGSVNISWLRKADEVFYERTWFAVTRTWVGSPVGHWDAQLYTQGPRPTTPGDYLTLAS